MENASKRKRYVTEHLYLSFIRDALLAIRDLASEFGFLKLDPHDVEEQAKKINDSLQEKKQENVKVFEDEFKETLKLFLEERNQVMDGSDPSKDPLIHLTSKATAYFKLGTVEEEDSFKEEMIKTIKADRRQHREGIDDESAHVDQLSEKIVSIIKKLVEFVVRKFQEKTGETFEDPSLTLSGLFEATVAVLKGIFTLIGGAIAVGSAASEAANKLPTSESSALKKAGVKGTNQEKVKFKCPSCKGWSATNMDKSLVYKGATIQCSCINCRQPIEGKIESFYTTSSGVQIEKPRAT